MVALPQATADRLVWAALHLLLPVSAYEDGPSSLSVLEASLVKLKKESAELHEHGALREVKPLQPLSPGAAKAGADTNIATVRSLEARLSSENQRLRQQLRRPAPLPVTGEVEHPDSKVSLLSTTGVYGDHSFALMVRLLLLFCVINTAIYLLWNVEGPTVEKVKRRAAEPLMRAIGRGTYEVEMSELQAKSDFNRKLLGRSIMMPMWASNDAMRIMEPEETGKITVRERACSFGCMFLATILHGVGSGMVGIFIAHFIRTVQIVGFGHDHGGFLEIALESNPWRRMACVIGGGLIGSAAWFWLRGRSTYLVTVEESLKGAKMPPVATVMNAMVQDVVVALGGSFGREAAPREIAAMWGGWVGDAFRVSTEQRKILVACGAGAGLAAVYSVPISGALYTIEHVLNWDISMAAVLPAITTSVVATLVTSTTVETHGLYSMPRFSYQWPTWDVCLFALLVGPVAGLGAACFRRFIKFVEGYKPLGRVPVDFQNVKVNDEVWVSRDKEGYIYRVKVRILHTVKNTDGTGSITSVVVRTAAESDEEYGEEEYMNEEDWFEAHAEGPRDWTIFVFMPLAFLVLALLSRYYPSLLGNGRALAEIAMQRKRSTFLLGMLLLLKALMTAAAIGSGAAGGTLTPSVALGATLGAIVGESYQYYLPDWAPAEDGLRI
eukprot:symbB.v1.2.012013.t1/scaffold769.1/size163963/17